MPCLNSWISWADLAQEYDMANAGRAWTTGDFDLFPAGSGQVCALIKEIKPVKDIIEEMVSGWKREAK